jgi:hypothetical protein
MAEKVPVKKGDTLSSIAKANKTTVAQILADNPTLAARASAGQTVLYSGTKVKITAPNTSNNPYGASQAGTGAGLGTRSNPVSNVASPTGVFDVGSFRAYDETDKKITGVTGVTPTATSEIPTDGNKTKKEVSRKDNGDGTFTVTYDDGSTEVVGTKNPTGKKEVSRVKNPDGTFTVTYDDGTTEIVGTPTGKTVTRTEILGSGANRVIRTYYSDGTYTDTPAPDTSQQGMTPEDVQKAIDAALAKSMASFQAQLTAQQKAAEQAKLEQLAKERKSAYDIITERFTQMGVPEFGKVISDIFKGEGVDRSGKKFDEIPTTTEGFYLQLIQTAPYYERFGKVNEARIKAGYRSLDEKTIVGMEDEYQKVLTSYNAPKGFYDQTSDFQTFLQNNYTNVDVANVFQAYRDFVQSTNPAIRDQLKSLYGITDDMTTAYMIDPARGQSILEGIAGKNLNTAAALLEGLTKEQADIAQQYGAGSLAYGTQRQKFSQVAKNIQQYGDLASIYGENFGAKEAIAAEFGGDVGATETMGRLRATNLAQFSGTTGVGQRALRSRTV